MKNLIKIFLFFVIQKIFMFYIYSKTIDNMDRTSGWISGEHEKAIIKISEDSGYSGKSIKLDYDFTGGDYVYIKKDFRYMDFSVGDSIKFYYRGTGDKNNLEVKLIDADGSVFVKTLSGITNQPTWSELTLFYTGAKPDFIYGWGGSDNILDTTKIAKISFGVTKNTGGEGSVIIDNVCLYLSTPTIKILDNFDDSNDVNNFGGNNYVWGSTCSRVYISTVAYSGGAVELNYDVRIENNWAGFVLPLNGMNLRDTTHLSFFIKGKNGAEVLRVKIEDDRGGSVERDITDYLPGITTSWQEVRIPLSDFRPVLIATDTATTKLNFVFGYAFGSPRAGTVYIDEIKFFQPGAAETVLGIIDDLDYEPNKLSSWITYGDVSYLRSVPGYSGRAVELVYKFMNEPYAVMERELCPNIAQDTHLQFRYKGNLENNNIELKLIDNDGTIFFKKFYNVPNTLSWESLITPVSELSYFSKELGADINLNLQKIKSIEIVVSKSNIETKKSGTVWFDELEAVFAPNFETKKDIIIENLSLPYNPISPNNDGIKDKALFVYKLKDYAEKVKLEIFTLKGEKVWSYEDKEKIAGKEYTIEWSAVDETQSRVPNGIYIYRFLVVTPGGKKEEIKHIIGVIR